MLSQYAPLTAHKLPVGGAKLAAAATTQRIETNPISGFDVFHLAADCCYNPGPIGAENTRQDCLRSNDAAPAPDISPIDGGGFELDDRVIDSG
jgi:hypothetical protein